MANEKIKVKKCDFCGTVYTESEIEEGNMKFMKPTGDNPKKIRICSKCIEDAHRLYAEEMANKRAKEAKYNIATPKEIHESLKEWVIDQDDALKTLAIAIYDHKKRIERLEIDPEANDELRLDKSNIIFLGPTGVGKTESVRAITAMLNLPFTIEDSSSITSNGYVGRDADEILRNLYLAADKDLEAAQKGIVFLDEFDKIKTSGGTRNDTKDVNGKAVQQTLLKMIEGAVMDVKIEKSTGKSIKFDTSNVLFIIGGAFVGLEECINKRLKQDKTKIGFGGTPEKKHEIDYNGTIVKVEPEDLEKYGLIPEVLGRCPIITVFKQLNEDSLIKILTEPKHAIIKQFKEEFKLDHIDLEFEDGAYRAIAKLAVEKKLGARALRTILEKILKEAKYEAPGTDITKVIVKPDLEVAYKHAVKEKTNASKSKLKKTSQDF